VTTTSTYDPLSFRLTRQHAVRDPAGTPVSVQDLRYTCDAAGNVVKLQDLAQQAVYFDNAVVDATSTYAYDDSSTRPTTCSGRAPAQSANPPPRRKPHARPSSPHHPTPATSTQVRLKLPHANHSAQLRASTGRRMATPCSHAPKASSFDTYANNLVFTHTSSGASQRVHYVYDAGGQRVRKVVEVNQSGTWNRTKETRYLGGFKLQLTFVGSTLDHERETFHVMDGSRRVALIETDTIDAGSAATTPSPLLRYQLDNHLRSACVETNAAGDVISYEEFHPYGTTAYHAGLSSLDANPKRYRYSGKERDSESGLYYYGARYLAPWLGRWVSPDPSGFVDGVNVYAFVKGRPSSGWDADGRESWINDAMNWMRGGHQQPQSGPPSSETASPPPAFSPTGTGDTDDGSPVNEGDLWQQFASMNGFSSDDSVAEGQLVIALRGVRIDRLQESLTQFSETSGRTLTTAAELTQMVTEIAEPVEHRHPSETDGYQDTLVVIQEGAVSYQSGASYPYEDTYAGAPNVNSTPANDVGIVRPGQYILQPKRTGHHGRNALELLNVASVRALGVDERHIPYSRDLDQDRMISTLEEAIAADPLAFEGILDVQVNALGFYGTYTYFHPGAGTYWGANDTEFTSIGCQTADPGLIDQLHAGGTWDYLIVHLRPGTQP
jgi:RHS repeat-associated protein